MSELLSIYLMQIISTRIPPPPAASRLHPARIPHLLKLPPQPRSGYHRHERCGSGGKDLEGT